MNTEEDKTVKDVSAPSITEEEIENRTLLVGNASNPKIYKPGEEGVDQMVCRCCLGGIEDGGDFISPCRCTGSSTWVHRHCLDQWRIQSPNPQSFYQCDVCQFKYKFENVKNVPKCLDYTKYILLVLLDFSLIVIVWQILVAASCGIILLADNKFVVEETIFGETFNKVLGTWILGNALFFFCLGLIGIVVVLGVLSIKCLGCASGNSGTGSVMTDLTYHHGWSYSSSSWLDYFLCWYICTHTNTFSSPGPMCCCENTSCDCPNLSCSDLNLGDCDFFGGSSSSGDGDGAGIILGIIAAIAIAVIVLVICIGIIVGTILLVYAIYTIVNRRFYLIKKRDDLNRMYVMDLADKSIDNME